MPNISIPINDYLWSDGSTGSSLTVNATELLPGSSNTYSVTITSNSCTATDDIIVIIEDANAISEIELLNENQFYPNPTSDFLHLLEENITSVRIYDLTGKRLGEWSNTNTIDLKSLSSGVYMIELKKDGGVKFGRFLKL